MFQWILDSFFAWFYLVFITASLAAVLGALQFKRLGNKSWHLLIILSLIISALGTWLCLQSALYKAFGLAFIPLIGFAVSSYRKKIMIKKL
jgi:hypothetical protein